MADAKPQLDPALVERACISQEGGPELWDLMYPSGKVVRRAAMARALLSLGIPAAALNALAKGEAVVVPKEVPWWTTKEAWEMELAASPYAKE